MSAAGEGGTRVRSLDVRVTGRVQGVYYRASCCERARELGVRGWVRNAPDGSVSAHVEGEDAAVSALIAWMRQGPPAAWVRSLDASPAPAAPGERGFRVAY